MRVAALAAIALGKFSLTLKPGTYTTYCPGGTTSERGTLEVTGKGAAASAETTAAVAAYRRYVEQQTDRTHDALNEYITHNGSALFAVPPGVRPGGYVGEGLFA